MTFSRACLAILIPVALSACDLPAKNLGNESDSMAGSGSGSEGTSAGGGQCMDGDTMPAPDGCNQCECLDGQWACTEIGCGSEGPPPVCTDGDSMPAPDGCNTCTCIDGAWGCTELPCPSDDGTPVCEDGDTMPAPDGCNTCTCEGGAWSCTEMACGGMGWFGDAILVCDPGAPEDPFFITQVTIEADAMLVDLSYGGGCKQHDFGLCWDGSFAKSDPVQIDTFIAHDGHDDPCDAEPSEQRSFDLVPLKQAAQAAYGSEHGEVMIHLDGWAEAISYTF